ncbi:MAG TPA: hypothetical protein VMI75_17250 [Polyangiaceae bacterium]|nr:hypothetical protein [Polyangiaceae bacterium]
MKRGWGQGVRLDVGEAFTLGAQALRYLGGVVDRARAGEVTTRQGIAASSKILEHTRWLIEQERPLEDLVRVLGDDERALEWMQARLVELTERVARRRLLESGGALVVAADGGKVDEHDTDTGAADRDGAGAVRAAPGHDGDEAG